MNNKHYIGRRESRFEEQGKTIPFTGVSLLVDDENEFFAGSRDGRVIEITCPYGTQAMANNLLASLTGKSYIGYTAGNAVTDPEAELGDGVTVGGIYSLLATRQAAFGAGHLGEISAPVEGDLDHEYGQESFAESVDRKLAGTRSYIEKSAEEIKLGVESLVDDRMAEIDVTLQDITSTVKGLGDSMTEVKQTAEGIKTTVDSLGNTYVAKADWSGLTSSFATKEGVTSEISQSLKGISLKVTDGKLGSSASITLSAGGESSSGTINLKDVRSAWANDDKSDVTVKAGSINFNGGGINITGGSFSVTSGTASFTNNTFSVESDNFKVTSTGNLTANSADLTYVTLDAGPGAGGELRSVAALIKGNLYMLGEYSTGSYALYGATKNSGNATLVYASTNYNGNQLSTVLGYDCATRINGTKISIEGGPSYDSDRDLKKDIIRMPEKYLRLLDEMEPVIFRYKKEEADAALHTGYIAQEMESAIVRAGLTRADVAALVGEDGTGQMGIVYSDIIPILHLKIKQLENRIKILEASIA